MHNVQIALDEDLYNRYKILAKKDRRSVRSYITKMIEDNLPTEPVKKISVVNTPVPAPATKGSFCDTNVCADCGEFIPGKADTRESTGELLCRPCLRKEMDCLLCGVPIGDDPKPVGTWKAGWTHRECFEKENG